MKKLVSFISFFISISFQIEGQWFVQNQIPNAWLIDVSFADSNNGLAVGFSYILKSTDGGKNWSSQTSGIEHSCRGVSFVDSTNAWIITDTFNGSSLILNSTNGGVDWKQQLTYSFGWFNSVYFVDKYHGWAVGGRNRYIHFSRAWNYLCYYKWGIELGSPKQCS